MTKGFCNNVLFRFPISHTYTRDIAGVTKTTDPFLRYTCVMRDYAPFQKCAHYVTSAYLPLCVQHIVFDTNQFQAISLIITVYSVYLFTYKICTLQNFYKTLIRSL